MTFFRNYIRTIAAISTMVFLVSCSNDINESADGLVDSSNIAKETIFSTPNLITTKINSITSHLFTEHLLGDYTNDDFGNIKAGFVSQLEANSYPVKRADTTALDIVKSSDIKAVLQIPITLFLVNGTTDKYELSTAALGNANSVLEFQVVTFTNFLQEFNEETKTIGKYFSNNNSVGTETIINSGVSNYEFKKEYTDLTRLNISSDLSQATDTIAIVLDSDYFKTNFIDKLDDEKVIDKDRLNFLFRGIKVTAKNKSGNTGLVVPVELSRSTIKIEYKNKYVNDKGDIINKNKRLVFPLEEVNYGLLDHDHKPKNTMTSDKAYVQGAGGYEVRLNVSDLINKERKKAYIDERWIINQAKLKVFVDDVSDDFTLNRLYIFAEEKDGSLRLVSDYDTVFGSKGVERVDGLGRFENESTKENPFVEFFITNEIKQAFEDDGVETLVIRAESSIDNVTSTTARGITLLNDVNSLDKAPVLEVVYSKKR